MRIPGGTTDDSGLRGDEHHPEGTGSVGERNGRPPSDPIHQEALRSGYLRSRYEQVLRPSSVSPSKLQQILLARSAKLFSVIDENSYVLLATTVTTVTEAEGDTSGMVLLGVGRIRSEIVVVLEEVTNSARLDLKRSIIG